MSFPQGLQTIHRLDVLPSNQYIRRLATVYTDYVTCSNEATKVNTLANCCEASKMTYSCVCECVYRTRGSNTDDPFPLHIVIHFRTIYTVEVLL